MIERTYERRKNEEHKRLTKGISRSATPIGTGYTELFSMLGLKPVEPIKIQKERRYRLTEKKPWSYHKRLVKRLPIMCMAKDGHCRKRFARECDLDNHLRAVHNMALKEYRSQAAKRMRQNIKNRQLAKQSLNEAS